MFQAAEECLKKDLMGTFNDWKMLSFKAKSGGADTFTRAFLDARLTWYVSPPLPLRGVSER